VVIAAPLGAAALLAAGRAGRAAGGALLALSVLALALTHQRGAWLAALAQGALAAAILGRGRWRDRAFRRTALAGAGAALLAAVLLAAAQPGLVSGLASRVTNPDLLQRPHLWRAAVVLFLERPLLGWGIGAFEPALEARAPVAAVRVDAHGEAHSTPLHLAAERGLAGLLALAVLAVAAFRSARDALRRDDDRPLAVGRALALAGGATYALVQYVWYPPAVGALVWMVLGGGRADPSGRPEAAVRHAAAALVALAVLVAAGRLLDPPPLRPWDDRSLGFHRPERTDAGAIRWTQRRAATRLDCRGTWLLLDLANGHPLGPARPVEVAVRVDGRRVAVVDVPGDWQRAVLPIGDACADGSAVVELVARPAFRPFSDFRRDSALPPSPDERELGVAVRELRVE
jgi:hypothetical protein